MLPLVYEHLTSERLGSLSFQLPEEALVHIAIDKEVKVPDQCPGDIPFADAVALALPQGLRPDLKADAIHRLMTLRCELECDQAALKTFDDLVDAEDMLDVASKDDFKSSKEFKKHQDKVTAEHKTRLEKTSSWAKDR